MLTGLPHSEISGSTLICKLPEAYRMLQRPSSPLTAKASTVCTYSLDLGAKQFTEATDDIFIYHGRGAFCKLMKVY